MCASLIEPEYDIPNRIDKHFGMRFSYAVVVARNSLESTKIDLMDLITLPMALGLMTLFLGLIKMSPPSYFRCSMANKHRFNFV